MNDYEPTEQLYHEVEAWENEYYSPDGWWKKLDEDNNFDKEEVDEAIN